MERINMSNYSLYVNDGVKAKFMELPETTREEVNNKIRALIEKSVK